MDFQRDNYLLALPGCTDQWQMFLLYPDPFLILETSTLGLARLVWDLSLSAALEGTGAIS